MQLTSAWAPKDSDFRIPAVSEVLGWFSLPIMAEAQEGDEKEAEARRMLKAVRDLAKKQNVEKRTPV